MFLVLAPVWGPRCCEILTLGWGVVSFSWWGCYDATFFPRASEPRVLLKVGVCYTSSHVYIFITFSHLLIFTSSHLHTFKHPHILSDSHLHIFFSSSHLHILTSAHLHTSSLSLSFFLSLCPSLSLSCRLSRSLSFFFFSVLRQQAMPTRRGVSWGFRLRGWWGVQ